MTKKLMIVCFVLILLSCFSVSVVAEAFITWPDNTIEVDYAPTNIIVSDDGTSYVTNNAGGIMKYLSDGTLDTNWGESGKAVGEIRPIFLCFDANGDILTGSADYHSGLFRLNAQTGESEVIIENVEVVGIAVDSENSIYLNTGYDLFKYQDMKQVWAASLISSYEMGLCLLPDKSIITTDESNGSVQKYTSEGMADLSFGTNGILKVSESNIGFASYDDQLYVSCYGEGVIKKISLENQNVEPVLTGASPTVLVAKNNYYFITNWLNNSIDCFEKPNVNVEDDQFTFAVNPRALNPGDNSVVTIDIFSNSIKEYDVTAKVYRQSDNELVSDIMATTATLANGDASIELIPPSSGWPAGLFYIEIIFSDNVENIIISDSLRIESDILIAECMEYTISFNSNGGSEIDPITADYASLITAPTAPTKAGHDFAGWYKDSGLTTAWNFETDTVPAEEIILYGKWRIKEYTVIFEDHDGTVIDTQKVQYKDAATAPEDPTRMGYTFADWSEDFSSVTSDIEVTATYTARTDTAYNVEHYKEAIDGSYVKVHMDNLTGTTGASVTAVAKIYKGFSENTTHENRVDSGTISGDGSTVLKLYYDRNEYTVRFVNHDGSVLTSDDVMYGDFSSTPNLPTRAYHCFAGWFTDNETFANEWIFTENQVSADTTLYAKWTKIPQSVTRVRVDDQTAITVDGLSDKINLPEVGDVNIADVVVFVKADPVQIPESIKEEVESEMDRRALKLLGVFDIGLYKRVTTYEGATTETSISNEDITGKIIVRIPLTDEQAKKDNLAIAYVDDEGNVTVIAGKIVTEGDVKYFEFETDHFSTYTLVEITEIPIPTTGEKLDSRMLIGILTLLLAMSTLFVTRYTVRKPKENIQ